MHRLHVLSWALVLAALGTGCANQDPVGIRFRLLESSSLSGDFAMASLSVPEISVQEEKMAKGVDWNITAKLTVTSGSFKDINNVKFADLDIECHRFDSGNGSCRITLPRGKDASWFRLLQVGPEKRGQIGKAMDSAIELHHTVTVVFEVGDARTSITLNEPVPKVSTNAKKGMSLAIIPLEVLEAEGSPIVLQVQWEAPKKATAKKD